MLDQGLVDYVRQCRASGMTDAQISQVLLSAGWAATDVNSALSPMSQVVSQAVSSQPRPLSVQPTEPLISSEKIFIHKGVKVVSVLGYSALALLVAFGLFKSVSWLASRSANENIKNQQLQSIRASSTAAEELGAPTSNLTDASEATTSTGTVQAILTALGATTSSSSVSFLPKKPNVSVELTPTPGATYGPNDEILVSVYVSGEKPGGVMFDAGYKEGGARAFHVQEGPGPYAWKFVGSTLGSEMGRYDIRAVSMGTLPVPFEKSTYILRLPEEEVYSIKIFGGSESLSPLYLTPEGFNTKRLRINGLMSNGDEVALTRSSAGTVYKTGSGTTKIVSVDPEGLITARGVGSDTIIVTNRYASKPATVKVTVEEEFGY